MCNLVQEWNHQIYGIAPNFYQVALSKYLLIGESAMKQSPTALAYSLYSRAGLHGIITAELTASR